MIRRAPLLFGCALVLGLGVLDAIIRPPVPDVAWQLYLADAVLSGARLGVDYVEVNPPLFVWMSIPAALVGRVADLPSWWVLVVLLSCAIILSVVLSVRLQGNGLGHRADGHASWPLVAIVSLALIPSPNFAQREHLALVCVLPLLVAASRRAAREEVTTRSAVAAGVLGGIGVALKPFFLLPFFFVELYVLRCVSWRKVFRPEVLAIVIVGVVYMALIALLSPEYVALALSLRGLYQTYLQQPLFDSLWPTPVAVLPMVVALTWLAARTAGSPSAPHTVFTLAAIGFWLSAAVQRKGLPYHYVTATGFSLLALSLVRGTAWRGVRGRLASITVRGSEMLAGLLALASLWSVVHGVLARTRPGFDPDLVLLLPVVEEARGEKVAVFSSNPTSGWPLTYLGGAEWAFRYVSLWLLPVLYPDHGAADLAPVTGRPLQERIGAEREFHEAVIKDLQKNRPSLVLVMSPDLSAWWAWGGATRFDYLAYFGSDPRFIDFMRAYQFQSQVGRYIVYRRRGNMGDVP